jgi:uncharacterized protein
MKSVRYAVSLAITLLLAACATSSPPTHFYTLSAENPAADVKSEPNALKVSVWQVTLPDVVDRNQMVVRLDPNRVEIADFHRWAEPLRRAIPRVLAENLARQLGSGYIVFAGQPAALTPEVRIALDLQKFDALMGEGVAVEALWTVRAPKGEVRTGQASVAERAAAGDHAAIAAAYSRALTRLAREVAETVRALPRNRAPG